MHDKIKYVSPKSKYALIKIFIRNGDYEYFSTHVEQSKRARTCEQWDRYAEDYIKDFYGGDRERTEPGWTFHNGLVYVGVESLQVISQEDYEVLKRFL